MDYTTVGCPVDNANRSIHPLNASFAFLWGMAVGSILGRMGGVVGGWAITYVRCWALQKVAKKCALDDSQTERCRSLVYCTVGVGGAVIVYCRSSSSNNRSFHCRVRYCSRHAVVSARFAEAGSWSSPVRVQ